MFSSLRLFQNLVCPERDSCQRPQCIFSHRTDLPQPDPLIIPRDVVINSGPVLEPSLVPTKRPVPSPARNAQTSSPQPAEPPRKFQRTGPTQKPVAVPSDSRPTTGVPILRINAAMSLVAIPVRQTMVKTLFDHFVVLYNQILLSSPTIASEHALKQEEEIYKKSTKVTYRNAVIQCAAALKRRPTPNSLSHPSVGTEGELAARVEAQKALQSVQITRAKMEPFVLSLDDLKKWGYLTELPDGPGGDVPSLEGKVAKCERCSHPFMVKRMEEADECIYHWGKPYTATVNASKVRLYTCCSRPVADSEGCSHGPHVFIESKTDDLHSRYPFSFLNPPESSQPSTALEVAAMDCEMVYTTAGMRVARVSVVDGTGKEVFDELVRMDDGVHVIDYITRFSGITPEGYATALLTLSSIRKSLDAFINAETILIGHALENDLKTLRIVHHKCVDTAILLPHKAGPPYRRSLKDLVREKLGKLIQSGDGSVGHSSVEDATATLDLVRWFILNAPKREPGKPKTIF